MKFAKPILVLITILILTYTVSASNVSFNHLEISSQIPVTALPLNGDLLFALCAIASLGGYLALKK
ncbi:hypothetical protein [Pedobacter insulae]|uniref:Uncharacterized protein n=1 Tax=Pedobacter insulae TaxID=414048 RepID=A0A1I3A6G9_9SPHI|nr:hypothetical protein [Pedobacter insulae]SFH45707.1 hypothetical protein SAMN04489864_11345 [Pedobacter insulae]